MKLEQLTKVGDTDEKEAASKLEYLEEFVSNNEMTHKNYQAFLIEKHKNSTNIEMEQKCVKMKKQVGKVVENFSSITNNKSKHKIKYTIGNDSYDGKKANEKIKKIKNDIRMLVFSDLFGSDNKTDSIEKNRKEIKWRLDVCSRSDEIINNGQTYKNDGSKQSLARSSTCMKRNFGVYCIKWKIDGIPDNSWDMIGLCTKQVDTSSNWFEGANYVGWSDNPSCTSPSTPNGIACGGNKHENNQFYKCMSFVTVGDKKRCDGSVLMPGFKKNDIVKLLYNSNKNTLQFELNGKNVGYMLVNLPKNEDFYWCIGGIRNPFQASIVSE